MLAVSFPFTAAQHTCRCFPSVRGTLRLLRYSQLDSCSFFLNISPRELCRASGPQDINQGGSGQPPNTAKPITHGDADDEDSGRVARRSWPTWYTVWIWATALTYLVWRYKWRRDRRLTAEQLANEQQQEEELQQEWYAFAKSYGVNVPPRNTS